MNQFFLAMEELVIDASKKLSSGDRNIESEPKIPKQMMKMGVEMEVKGFKTFKARMCEENVVTLLVPSGKCGNPTRTHYEILEQTKWKSFDEYVAHGFNQFYILHVSQSDWKTQSKFSCPAFFKQNMCKHIIAAAIQEKLLDVSNTMNPSKLSNQRKKPGRPKAAKTALIVQ